MTRRCIPAPELYPHTPPSNEGDGHVMAAELGAGFALMDQTISMPSVRVPGEENDGRPLYRLLFQELALPHSLVVNRAGRRFANETFFQDLARGWTLSDRTRSTFPNLPSFFVFDEQYCERYGLPASLAVGECLGRYETLTDLATARRIDQVRLQLEIERFNEAVRLGRDLEFHRGETAYQRAFADPSVSPNPTLGTVEHAPFYCLELHPGTSGHRGGVVTDEHGAVLSVRGARIRGLYACGNTAAGLVTGASYITGASIGHSIVFGSLAAQDMLARAAG